MSKAKPIVIGAAVLLLAGCSAGFNLPWVKKEGGAAVEQGQPAAESAEASAQTSGIGSPEALNAEQADVAGGQNTAFYFGFDGSTLTPSAQTALDTQANYLLSHPRTQARLEGNTDERGSREYNVALGWRRSRAVSQYLQQTGVPSQQLRLLSYGKEHPQDGGHTPLAWQHNRRVDLVYTG